MDGDHAFAVIQTQLDSEGKLMEVLVEALKVMEVPLPGSMCSLTVLSQQWVQSNERVVKS